jgi:hypothetical protein
MSWRVRKVGRMTEKGRDWGEGERLGRDEGKKSEEGWRTM